MKWKIAVFIFESHCSQPIRILIGRNDCRGFVIELLWFRGCVVNSCNVVETKVNLRGTTNACNEYYLNIWNKWEKELNRNRHWQSWCSYKQDGSVIQRVLVIWKRADKLPCRSLTVYEISRIVYKNFDSVYENFNCVNLVNVYVNRVDSNRSCRYWRGLNGK